MCAVQCLKCCFIIPEDNLDINGNFMERWHNVNLLESPCVPVVVPTVVNVLIWAKQMPSSHRLHEFSEAWVPTRPRSKSQQCISGYYKAGTDRFAALSFPALRLPLQPLRYCIHQPSICSECKYSTIIQFGCVYLAHQSDGAVVSNLE